MVVNNSSIRLTKVIADAILAGINAHAFADLTQFLVEVTLMANVLGILTSICLLVYIKVTCPYYVYGDGTKPRTFHSARYDIVPYIPKAKSSSAE